MGNIINFYILNQYTNKGVETMTNYNNSAERALVSRAIAREGIILLENKNNTLPLG
jgi:hypothetical protein